MDSHLISFAFAFACTFTLGLLLVSAENGPYGRVPARLLQPPFSSTVKAVSLATDSYTGDTNVKDVSGLASLCKSFPSLLELNDDPCLPPKWSWIECNNDDKPRVTALYLGAKNIFGLLPDFSSMDALETIDLHQNFLTGAIPPFLGTLPYLQELNLANNYFSGSVPNTLACNKNLNFSNRCLTSDPESPATRTNSDPTISGGTFEYPDTNNRKKKKNKLPTILGSTGSVMGVIWITVGIFAIFRHRAKAAAAMAAASASGQDGVPSNPNLDQNSSSMEEMPIHPHVKDSP